MIEKRNVTKALVPLVLALGVIGGFFIGKYASFNRLSPEEEKIRMIMSLIEQQYVDEIDTDSLLDKAIPDILAQLDPHSVYIPASELEATNDDLESSFGGVGVMFQVLNDTVNVVEVVAGGPAESVGSRFQESVSRARMCSRHCAASRARKSRSRSSARLRESPWNMR